MPILKKTVQLITQTWETTALLWSDWRQEPILRLDAQLRRYLNANEVKEASELLASLPFFVAKKIVNQREKYSEEVKAYGYAYKHVATLNRAQSKEAVELLLRYQVDLSVIDSHKKTAAHTAYERNRTEVLECLLENGININVKITRRTKQQIERIDQETMGFIEFMFKSARYWSQIDKLSEALDLVLKNGCSPNELFTTGYNPLLTLTEKYKMYEGRVEAPAFKRATAMLLRYGANPHMKTAYTLQTTSGLEDNYSNYSTRSAFTASVKECLEPIFDMYLPSLNTLEALQAAQEDLKIAGVSAAGGIKEKLEARALMFQEQRQFNILVPTLGLEGETGQIPTVIKKSKHKI